MSQDPIPNIIIFGETGAGKSSVVNLILGKEKAATSKNAEGCTFSSTSYPVTIQGKSYNLYDTAGLNEASTGRVEECKAIANLFSLVNTLANSGGVNLLVFVVKCGRLTQNMKKNYEVFHNAFCEKQVPIVLVATGCEDVEPEMDGWWGDNKGKFEKAGMLFSGHACVCASRGSKNKRGFYRNEDQYEESIGKVDALIAEHCRSQGWKKGSYIPDGGV